MSVPEEAGKALSIVTEAMKSQPLAIGLLVINALWIGFFIWFSISLRDRNTLEREYFRQQIERCENKGGNA